MHSVYSPSSAYRWINCPGSLEVTDQDRAIQDQKDTSAADRGTLGHTIVEEVLKTGHFKSYPKADEDLLDAAAYCVKEAEKVLKWYSSEASVSQEVRLTSTLIEDFGGTIDLLIHEGAVVHVVDFKFGVHYVDVKDNPQLLSYLVLARDYLQAKGRETSCFRATVVQPAHGSGLDTATVEYRNEDLDAFLVKVLEASLTRERKPGDHCQYCPLLYRCNEQASAAFDVYQEDIDVKDPTPCNVEDVVRVFKAARLAKQAYDDANGLIKDWARKGHINPADFGITISQSPRVYWISGAETFLETELEEAVLFKKTPRSPRELQKELGLDKEEFEDSFKELLEIRNVETTRVGKAYQDPDFDDLTS